jgi:hypothetical protein
MADTLSSPFDLPTDGLVPLIIGVTGHRDLRPQDVPALEAAVRENIRKQRALYPNTPLILLSPLGEGVDRLAARVALQEGVQLFVPLPLPIQFYELDFSGPESRAEFDGLLKQATRVFTLPWLYCEERNSECEAQLTEADAAEHRAEQYAQLGAYLARHSHIFLALWDGDNFQGNELLGGTAQVVRFRLEGAPPPYGPARSPLEGGGYGSAHHILTPRLSKPEPGGQPGTCSLLTAKGATGDNEEHYKRLDMFNRDVKKYKPLMGATALQNVGFLLGEDSGVAVPTLNSKPSSEPGPWPALAIFAWSDTLSTQFARMMNKTVQRIFMLVFVAAFSFNLFHSLPHGGHGGGHEEGAEHVAMAGASSHETTAEGHAPASEPGHGEPAEHAAPADHGHGEAAGHTAPTEAGHDETAGHTASAASGHGEAGQGHESPAEPATGGAGHGESVAAVDGGDEGFRLSSLLQSTPAFLWFYLLVVVANLLLHRRAVQNEYQNKYQDYRALAEGLRVQTFWRLGGLSDEANDHYLGKQRGELAWIQNAIKGFNVLADGNEFRGAGSGAGELPLVMRQWVREQRNYYIRKVKREEKDLEKSEQLIGGLLLGSIVLAFILAVALSSPAGAPILGELKEFLEQSLPHAIFMITVVTLAVSAGLLHGYNQHFARAEHVKRFSRMSTLFDAATQQIEEMLKTNREGEIRAILKELGREALSENGDWVLLHRERPLEVPHAG